MAGQWLANGWPWFANGRAMVGQWLANGSKTGFPKTVFQKGFGEPKLRHQHESNMYRDLRQAEVSKLSACFSVMPKSCMLAS